MFKKEKGKFRGDTNTSMLAIQSKGREVHSA